MNTKKDNKLIIFGVIVVIILAIIAFCTRKVESDIDYETMNDEEMNYFRKMKEKE